MDQMIAYEVVKFITNKRHEADTFEKISEKFHQLEQKFESRPLGDYLSILLEESIVRDVCQKSLSVFLLWDVYKAENLHLNPYLGCIYSKLTESASDFPLPNQFKVFMQRLMLHPERATDLLRMTLLQILNADMDDKSNETIDFSGVESALLKQRQCMPKSSVQSLSNVIPDPEKSRSVLTFREVILCLFDQKVNKAFLPLNFCSQSLSTEQYVQAMVENSEVLLSLRKPLHPELIRLQPPPMPTPQIGTAENSLEVPTEEFVWLNPPTLSHEFHWDSTMGSSQSAPKLEIQQLASLSLTVSLTVAQREELIRAIKDDCKSVSFSPENFSSLVSENPTIATEYLISIQSEDELDLFLAALLEMDLNVGLLEVINQTSSRIKLPNKFVLNCIPHVLTKCQSIEDKNAQMRIARLVCLFTMSWLRNKTLNINKSSIFAEIESFCLAFCKVKEANLLYRQVKNLESGTPVDKDS
ncbi:unnamed protein product [Hymenolepis diminuta]|uniref:CCR4-NOT transcription complex subunit 11 n=1 Tax=Hymenolepis diminuta TaxID=6216 RepID=A0A158QBX3_HYMDI|nr:unnamed protein product [Hymenolepis diminuta]